MKTLLIGITMDDIAHTDADKFDIDARFRMMKESGEFDYIDKTPAPAELELYQKASAKYSVPIRAGSSNYMLGRDEPLLEWHMWVCRALGSVLQNIQVKAIGADGTPVTNEQVANLYLWASEIGDRHGVTPSLETHVNMWSEHFGRVVPVGELVEKRGVRFNLTLDHAHVIFKIDNPREQEIQGLRADLEAGRVEIDPFKPGDVCTAWIERNWIAHVHARSAAPNNPVNVWAKHRDGSFGRGLQYPFIRPGPGEWHAEWDEAKLEPWKEVMRRLLNFHASRPESSLGQITMEFAPNTNLSAGAKYSTFENAIACARWIRDTWTESQARN